MATQSRCSRERASAQPVASCATVLHAHALLCNRAHLPDHVALRCERVKRHRRLVLVLVQLSLCVCDCEPTQGSASVRPCRPTGRSQRTRGLTRGTERVKQVIGAREMRSSKDNVETLNS
eukprot:6176025-Pleurochrysis_carterae.AAC.2